MMVPPWCFILPYVFAALFPAVLASGNSCKCVTLKCAQYKDDKICRCNGEDCDYDTCCTGRNSRLLTESGTSWKPEDTEYQEFVDRCGDFSYQGWLYVDSHLYAVASPMEEAVAAGCPFVVAHSVFADAENEYSHDVVRKELLVWMDKEQGETLFNSQGSLPFGTFKASDLAHAYENAEAGRRGATPVYDVIAHNCGDFIINLASGLDITIDAEVTAFVARRLVAESGKDLVGRIRNSVHYNSFLSGLHLAGSSSAEVVADEEHELVAQLVQSRAAELTTEKSD